MFLNAFTLIWHPMEMHKGDFSSRYIVIMNSVSTHSLNSTKKKMPNCLLVQLVAAELLKLKAGPSLLPKLLGQYRWLNRVGSPLFWTFTWNTIGSLPLLPWGEFGSFWEPQQEWAAAACLLRLQLPESSTRATPLHCIPWEENGQIWGRNQLSAGNLLKTCPIGTNQDDFGKAQRAFKASSPPRVLGQFCTCTGKTEIELLTA